MNVDTSNDVFVNCIAKIIGRKMTIFLYQCLIRKILIIVDMISWLEYNFINFFQNKNLIAASSEVQETLAFIHEAFASVQMCYTDLVQKCNALFVLNSICNIKNYSVRHLDCWIAIPHDNCLWIGLCSNQSLSANNSLSQ